MARKTKTAAEKGMKDTLKWQENKKYRENEIHYQKKNETIVAISPVNIPMYAWVKDPDHKDEDYLKPITHVALTAAGNVRYLIPDDELGAAVFAEDTFGFSGFKFGEVSKNE